MSKIKKQQDELRDALKETIKRQQQEEIAYVQKAENNLQKRQMNEQSFLKR